MSTPHSPYEAHVTMLIQCFSAMVCSFMLIHVLDSSIALIIFSAERLKPTCALSLGFQLWVGIVTFSIATGVLNVMKYLFFYERFKEESQLPNYVVNYTTPKGDIAMKVQITDKEGDANSNELKSIHLLLGFLTTSFLANNASSNNMETAPPVPSSEESSRKSSTTAMPQGPSTPDSHAGSVECTDTTVKNE